VSHTGVAGLTLGGGMGRLMRRYGLTSDNLLEVDLVTAECRHVRSSSDKNPDLFWALRGAGANFGIATDFSFQLHEAGPYVVSGFAAWPIERAYEIAEAFRSWSLDAPKALTASFSLYRAGDDVGPELAGRPVVAISAAHLGGPIAVARDLEAIRSLGPTVDTFAQVAYLDMQTAGDNYYAWGRRNYWKGVLLNELSDDTIRLLLARLEAAPSPGCGFGLITMGGALRDMPDEATAFSGRSANWWLTCEALWDQSVDDQAHIAWGRESLDQLLGVAAEVNYVNDLGEPGEQNLSAVYGDARYSRLVTLKQAWDPDNVFRLNQNINPSRGGEKPSSHEHLA
jgi:FAD/FMN-containing dehydrogenase